MHVIDVIACAFCALLYGSVFLYFCTRVFCARARLYYVVGVLSVFSLVLFRVVLCARVL